MIIVTAALTVTCHQSYLKMIFNVQSLSLKKTKKLKPEAEPTESLFTDILNNIKLVSLPSKWFAGYESKFIQSYDRWRHINCLTILDVTER